MTYNRDNLLANSITYLISFLIILWFKYLFDQIFNHPDFSSWILTFSIPVFGLVRIVAKDTIFNWVHKLFQYFSFQTDWNFSRFARVSAHILSIFWILALLPFQAFSLLIISFKYVINWLISVTLMYFVGLIIFSIIFLWAIPSLFQLQTIYNTFWNNIAVAFVFVWGITMPIIAGIGAVAGGHQEFTTQK
jgi:hypothetical protein